MIRIVLIEYSTADARWVVGAGAKVVVAESYARIFFRNCVAT